MSAGCVSTIRTWILSYLEWAALRKLLLTFISHLWLISCNFLRDRYWWLSPPTVTFFTPKRCKLHDDSFPLYCTTGGGGTGKPTVHAHVMMFDPLLVGRMPCRVKKTIGINRQERLQSRNELTRETKRHESSYKSSRVRQNERSNNIIKNGYNKSACDDIWFRREIETSK